MTQPDVSLGAVVREIPALIHLLNYIEQNAPSIYIREDVNGKIDAYPLADLPAPLALHYAFEFIRNCTIPIHGVMRTQPDPFEEFAENHEDEEP